MEDSVFVPGEEQQPYGRQRFGVFPQLLVKKDHAYGRLAFRKPPPGQERRRSKMTFERESPSYRYRVAFTLCILLLLGLCLGFSFRYVRLNSPVRRTTNYWLHHQECRDAHWCATRLLLVWQVGFSFTSSRTVYLS